MLTWVFSHYRYKAPKALALIRLSRVWKKHLGEPSAEMNRVVEAAEEEYSGGVVDPADDMCV